MKILDAKATKTFEGGPTYSLKNRAFRGIWSLIALRGLDTAPVYSGNPACRLKLRKTRVFDDGDAKA